MRGWGGQSLGEFPVPLRMSWWCQLNTASLCINKRMNGCALDRYLHWTLLRVMYMNTNICLAFCRVWSLCWFWVDWKNLQWPVFKVLQAQPVKSNCWHFSLMLILSLFYWPINFFSLFICSWGLYNLFLTMARLVCVCVRRGQWLWRGMLDLKSKKKQV